MNKKKQMGQIAIEKLIDAIKEYEATNANKGKEKIVYISRSFAADLTKPGSPFCKPSGIKALEGETIDSYKIIIDYDQEDEIRF